MIQKFLTVSLLLYGGQSIRIRWQSASVLTFRNYKSYFYCNWYRQL